MQRRANAGRRQSETDGELSRAGEGAHGARMRAGRDGKLTGREKRDGKECRGDTERPDGAPEEGSAATADRSEHTAAYRHVLGYVYGAWGVRPPLSGGPVY